MTFYDWWKKEKYNYPSSAVEFEDIENAAESAWDAALEERCEGDPGCEHSYQEMWVCVHCGYHAE